MVCAAQSAEPRTLIHFYGGAPVGKIRKRVKEHDLRWLLGMSFAGNGVTSIAANVSFTVLALS